MKAILKEHNLNCDWSHLATFCDADENVEKVGIDYYRLLCLVRQSDKDFDENENENEIKDDDSEYQAVFSRLKMLSQNVCNCMHKL